MKSIAVVTLVWQRPERFRKTMAMLKAQTDIAFDAFVLNNNKTLVDFVNLNARASDFHVSVKHSNTNSGSFGHLLMGHQCAQAGYQYIIQLDDDIDIEPHTIQQLRSQAEPNEIVSKNVFRFGDDYWDRSLVAIGETGDYAHGGISIVPASVYTDSLLNVDQVRWSPADDLWMSYHALSRGYVLRRGVVDATIVDDGKDQYHQHIDLKNKLLAELRKAQWPTAQLES